MPNAWLAGRDRCLTIFGGAYATGALFFPTDARVLEIGCAEADWMTPMLAERPDIQITGIDWRAKEDRPGTVIQGDVLTYDFPDGFFNVIVGISSLEHIGLGHYDHDPIDRDGDIHCFQRMHRWLAPGGWIYFDVPFGDHYRVDGTACRIYDLPAIESRLLSAGFTRQRTWYAAHEDVRTVCDAPPASGHGMTYVAIVATRD